MKYHFLARIIREVPDGKGGTKRYGYSHLRVIATSMDEATQLVEKHLAERKPLGFSEAEIRKLNPKRTPWAPGVKFSQFYGGGIPANGNPPVGVICD